jgi:ABC-2 type transport system permease protein
MTDALRAEWTKLTALRGTTWALVTMVILTIVLTGLITANSHTDGCPNGRLGCDDDMLEIALGGVYLGQLAAVALGVMAISSEFASGMIRTTFAATPRRHDVLLAKAAVIGGLGLAAGLLASVPAYLLGLSLLGGNGYTAANGYPGPTTAEALRGIGGTAVYLAVLALLSLGVGAVMRHAAAAISTVLGLLWVPLIFISMLPEDVGMKVGKFCPMLAGLAIQRTADPPSPPISPGAGLLVFCAYAAVCLGLGLLLVARRDA